MCLENLTLSDRKNVTDFLQIYFVIIKNALKIEQENVFINLENSTIKLIFISESDISDDSSINIHSSKWLHSAVINEDSILNFSADNILIIIISKSQQFSIKWNIFSTNMQILKQLFSAVVKKNSISDFSENITDKMQDDVSDNINSEFYVDQIIIHDIIAIKKILSKRHLILLMSFMLQSKNANNFQKNIENIENIFYAFKKRK